MPPKTRRERTLFALLVLSLIIGGLVGLWTLNREAEGDRKQAVEEAEAVEQEKQVVEEAGSLLAVQVLEVCAGDDKAARELRAQGICPQAQEVREVIEGPMGPPGPRGEPGPPPSDDQVMRAVKAFCFDNPAACKGSDGRSVSAAQVATAVAVYCDALGECQGPAGARGKDAPPPTAQQIEAAVAQYCGADSCDGPAGPPGEDGTQVVSFVCETTDDGVRLILNFAEDPAQAVALSLPGLDCA